MRISKFDIALIEKANELSSFFPKLIFLATKTQDGRKGISIESIDNFNNYKKEQDIKKFSTFYKDSKQLQIMSNINLSFPIEINRISELEIIESTVDTIYYHLVSE
mgnify:CR=1 FL=1